ncbi:MAG: YbjN domain-containing protein [Pseudomonadota bacterium]
MIRSWKTLLAALMLGLAATSPVSAQSNPQVVAQFDDATIARLLLAVQATWRTETGPDGRALYRASAEGGISFTLLPQACGEEQGCRALLVLANFTGVEADNVSTLDNFLHRFNDAYPSAKVYRVGENGVVLQAYLNAAQGISFANAQAQLLVFGQDLVVLRNELTALSSAASR